MINRTLKAIKKEMVKPENKGTCMLNCVDSSLRNVIDPKHKFTNTTTFCVLKSEICLKVT